jgi:hypothetical protein
MLRAWVTNRRVGEVVAAVATCMLATAVSDAATLYVDGSIDVPSCTDYDVASRSCGLGSATAYRDFAGATAAVAPGDTVLIREDVYTEALVPQTSGTAEDRIVFASFPGESVTITGSPYPAAIQLTEVSYLTIQGLHVTDCRWLESQSSHHNIVEGNEFLSTPSTGTTGNVRFVSSNHNRVADNLLSDGNDNLLLIDSDHNLVEDNILVEGRHSVFSIRCSNSNLIRGNYFANTQQKIGEVYDCGEDTTIVPHAFDATKRNVFENNVFAEATSYYSTSGGNGIQYAGQDGIVRRNVFYDANVGIGMQVYSDEALYNHHNRVYHNVFAHNECGGVSVNENNLDNVFVNNILYRNEGVGSGQCSDVGAGQIIYRGAVQGYAFVNNNLLNQTPGEAIIQIEFGAAGTLAAYQSTYPSVYVANSELEPGFRDALAHDFSLRHDSLMRDAGAFFTVTLSDGSGTVMPVADARYFHDGLSIEGVSGDRVQLEGQPETALVIAVDIATNQVTLDRPLSWSGGQGLALAYGGTAPDLGCEEILDLIFASGFESGDVSAWSGGSGR